MWGEIHPQEFCPLWGRRTLFSACLNSKRAITCMIKKPYMILNKKKNHTLQKQKLILVTIFFLCFTLLLVLLLGVLVFFFIIYFYLIDNTYCGGRSTLKHFVRFGAKGLAWLCFLQATWAVFETCSHIEERCAPLMPYKPWYTLAFSQMY